MSSILVARPVEKLFMRPIGRTQLAITVATAALLGLPRQHKAKLP